MEQFLLAMATFCSVAGIAATAVLLTRERRATLRLRRQNTALRADLDARDQEVRHLAGTRLPELLESLHNPAVTVSGPLHDARRLGPVYEQGIDAAMELVAGSVERVRARADQSAKSALRGAMRSVQSLAGEQQLVLSNMQDRHDDPDTLSDLLRLDHMNAQLGRRAQATAVLCGSWPGQQRAASTLSDVVRGATSRIRDYLRVEVHSPVNAAVTARAVEPVVLTVAELLDNAARHSQPDTAVEVNVRNTHNGIAIMIDDAGVAMDTEEIQHATRLLSGERAADVHGLGDPPQVGFAVAGVLAARYGFTVSVDTRSPYGGVRAVVFLPSELLTDVPEEPRAPEAAAVASGAAQARRAPAEPPDFEAPLDPSAPTTAGGLPKRTRASAAGKAAPGPGGPPPETGGPPVRPARATAAGLGAWQRGTRSGRAAPPPDSERKDPRP
ncbi:MULTISPECIES: ATP-binding protein [Thermomonosporaceae]|uniref:ATP-binding protein n=1 Tax=Thermomonosporaceae TaxID=2012 RepID=UPI00255ACFAB|nr:MULTISPECIES: ATP-binding protein [Thermomonosporaceae]MDL4777829.1 ATP-binding protein [Actinomadura xylanilytica]